MLHTMRLRLPDKQIMRNTRPSQQHHGQTILMLTLLPISKAMRSRCMTSMISNKPDTRIRAAQRSTVCHRVMEVSNTTKLRDRIKDGMVGMTKDRDMIKGKVKTSISKVRSGEARAGNLASSIVHSAVCSGLVIESRMECWVHLRQGQGQGRD